MIVTDKKQNLMRFFSVWDKHLIISYLCALFLIYRRGLSCQHFSMLLLSIESDDIEDGVSSPVYIKVTPDPMSIIFWWIGMYCNTSTKITHTHCHKHFQARTQVCACVCLRVRKMRKSSVEFWHKTKGETVLY